MGRRTNTCVVKRYLVVIAIGSAIPLVGLAAASASRVLSATPKTTATTAITATTAKASFCPADTNVFDAIVPFPESGVIASPPGQAGPLGAHILGPQAPNPYYEIGMPDNGNGSRPVGVMLEIHGGGWVGVGPATVGHMRPEADFWRSHGWETVNFDYRGCRASVGDVYAFYRRVRSQFGAAIPICASGQSVGATLALLLAVQAGPGLSCVISEAGFTDLIGLAGESAYPSGTTEISPQSFQDQTKSVFTLTDVAELAAISPLTFASSFTTPVLLATAANDVVVPQSQATTFGAAVLANHPGSYVDVEQLPCPSGPKGRHLDCADTVLQPLHTPNAVTFVHGMTSAAGISRFHQRALQLAAHVGAPG